MAKRFTRNIEGVEDIMAQPLDTNNQNDILSDDDKVYIRHKNQYIPLTGNVKTINNQSPDEQGNIDIESGGSLPEEVVTSVNGKTGDVNITIPEIPEIPELPDKLVNTVNGQSGDITLAVSDLNEGSQLIEDVDSLDKTITELPDLQDLQSRLLQLEDTKIKEERGTLDLEEGFTNYNGSSNPEYSATRLQYQRVGSFLKIFGMIKNTKELSQDVEYLVANIPEQYNVITRDTGVMNGSDKNTFFVCVYAGSNDEGKANTITIDRIRDNHGDPIDYTPGKWLNISLLCAIEEV